MGVSMLLLLMLPVLVAMVLAVVVGVMVRRRTFARVEEWVRWQQTARTLSWRDRREVYRANVQGRAVSERRLAPYAHQRALAALALVDAVSTPGRARLFLTCAVVFGVLGLAGLVRAVYEGDGVGLATSGLMLMGALLMSPRAQQFDRERAVRRLGESAAANAEVESAAAGDSGGDRS
jgi:hypothetical protein